MSDINVDLGNIRGRQGIPGNDGARGSLWYTGTALTHTEGTETTATGITGALVHDMYLNTETSDVYECTLSGDSGVAAWTFRINTKGQNGNGSLTTETAADGYTDVTFTDAEGEETQFRAGNTRESGQSQMSLISAFSSATVATNTCVARGDVVYAALDVSGFSISAATFASADRILAQLPEGYRPAAVHRLPVLLTIGSARYVGVVDVEPGGEVQTRFCPTSTGVVSRILFNFSFMRA